MRLVLALHGDRRYGRLAARWAACYAITAPAITVQRLQDMLELFADTEPPGRSDVAVLARAHGLPELADQLRWP